ncbi:MAG: ATP-binding protein [Lachnospiraceae bacterium]|nr:ATP-binding protein [Lachnospiraceae bacterium]
MIRKFNTEGACSPKRNYMVDMTSRLEAIKKMIEDGAYFTINRGRQYGKTTTLRAIPNYLGVEYKVISLDFQNLSNASYQGEEIFVAEVSNCILAAADDCPNEIREQLEAFDSCSARIMTLQRFFRVLSRWCAISERPIVLLIDEVDTATNNQIFLDFLAHLRAAYLNRDNIPTFQSVILAGVHDVRNIKRKIRPDSEHKVNSPWNIAADFVIDMNFSATEIAGMLMQYEGDHRTGMDVGILSELIYDYTKGYPVLVSRICKLIDERLPGTDGFPDKASAWTPEGVSEAVKLLLAEKNPLFESLWEKLNRYPEMKDRLYALLFRGQPIPYNIDDPVIDLLQMYGFIRNENGMMQMANRIFEVRLYNYFLMTGEAMDTEINQKGALEKNQFIRDGQLDMDRLLQKFIEYFDDINGDQGQKFVEDDGRRYFMLFLKPVINGTGNYYVEARTRNRERTDLIIDYLGKQYVIEMKVWHGNAYNERGEKQLSDYLDYYHLKKGYMLSFCFNKNKKIGMKEIVLGDKVLVEAVV